MKYKVERWNHESPPDAAELRSRMESEGFSVLEWTDQPGAIYPDHTHSDYQSHWILTGTLVLLVEGRGEVTLNAGDRDFMPAGTRHSATVSGGEPVHYLIGSKA